MATLLPIETLRHDLIAEETLDTGHGEMKLVPLMAAPLA